MHGTFSRPMKILASVITVAVLVAGILAWSTWRKKVTAEERQQAQAQQLKKHKIGGTQEKPLRLPQIS